ncbi:MAG: cupin domain-containing protein [Eubacteriales bacterium]|jgi:quercetin dioxygenase-like cupin family protein|nr:cupin domain-containing protein [Bacillota bacterium]MBV1726816.1 cupin domain-containing protein [Desulforudis sp.]MDP3050878.1 cupin domain-containing protein [Eubacteriales bacterium]MBU4554885.1 cupin domain-containing protein [Bacillota bacterium]MBV1735785.1 cupin domain-containing protein [Desulforudis sp.]
MFVENMTNIKSTPVNAPAVLNVLRQTLVGPEQGWDGWVMRLFTVGPAGHTPRHTHPWPHINFIVSGKGRLFLDGQEHEVGSGYVAYIPGGAEHQFRNAGTEDFALICIVPEEGDK